MRGGITDVLTEGTSEVMEEVGTGFETVEESGGDG